MRSKNKFTLGIKPMPNWDPAAPDSFAAGDAPRIEIEEMPEYDSKYWVRVYFANGATWVPLFEDLAHILKAIGWCEDQKYTKFYHQCKWMICSFVADVIHDQKTWAEIVARFQLPTRE